jgi:starvation-inducible DNA-binding protein
MVTHPMVTHPMVTHPMVSHPMLSHSSVSGLPLDIGISESHRLQIAAGLGRLLADSTVLYARTHGFHWNVTGPMFNPLHLMFMQLYVELWNALDVIAERIRALDHPAPDGGTSVAALEMVEELGLGQQAVARSARSLFALVEEANDQPTADLLTQRLQVHGKTAWMLRSLLEG